MDDFIIAFCQRKDTYKRDRIMIMNINILLNLKIYKHII